MLHFDGSGFVTHAWVGLDYKTSIPCCRWSEGPAHPSEASSPPPPQSALTPIRQMDPCQSFAQIKNATCFAPDSWGKLQMESVGTGRPSASYSCNMYKEKLGSIRKIGARADLIGRPAVYSLRTVISFFPTRAVTTTFHCREFSFHPLQQCLCHPSHDLKNRSKKGKNGIS